MPTYRLCYHNPSTGRLDFFTEFEAADDEAAIRSADARPDDEGKALWCGERSVKLAAPHPETEAPAPTPWSPSPAEADGSVSAPKPDVAASGRPPLRRRPRRPDQ